jgi:hypothetical protein
MTVLVALDGVLRNETGGPIYEGILLYRSLCQTYKMILCCDTPIFEAEHWLKIHGLNLHDETLDDSVAIVNTDLRIRQLKLSRKQANIELLVDPDPERVALSMREGVTSLLFCHPKYQRPEFRPESKDSRRSWADIQDEVLRQKGIETDPRLVLPQETHE